MLELWQTEWCPASRRVRQRLTELDLSYLVHQVPVAPEERAELLAATGATSVPVLVDEEAVLVGAEEILEHLESRYPEPAQAEAHRLKADRAARKYLEETCPPQPVTR
jgi:glutathione S-transferase